MAKVEHQNAAAAAKDGGDKGGSDSTSEPLDLIGCYNVVSLKSGKVLNVKSNSMDDGANVQLWKNPSSHASQWQFTCVDARSHHYNVTNVNSGKVLNVKGSSKDDKATVQQWSNPGKPSSQWEVKCVNAPKQVYTLVNVNSGKALNVAGGSTKDGALIYQWHNASSPDSQWRLQKVPIHISKIEGLEDLLHSVKVHDEVTKGRAARMCEYLGVTSVAQLMSLVQAKPRYREKFLEGLKLQPYPLSQLESKMKSWTESAADLLLPVLGAIRGLKVATADATGLKEDIDELLNAAEG
jgi:hypothetical protein